MASQNLPLGALVKHKADNAKVSAPTMTVHSLPDKHNGNFPEDGSYWVECKFWCSSSYDFKTTVFNSKELKLL